MPAPEFPFARPIRAAAILPQGKTDFEWDSKKPMGFMALGLEDALAEGGGVQETAVPRNIHDESRDGVARYVLPSVPEGPERRRHFARDAIHRLSQTHILAINHTKSGIIDKSVGLYYCHLSSIMPYNSTNGEL